MRKVIRVFHSFADAEAADRAYYRRLSPEQRVDIPLEMIARRRDDTDESSKGFERVYRVTRLGEG
ncbi:MAG: hypothetical protein ACE5E1_04125 [Phycisphaerae bacterium]